MDKSAPEHDLRQHQDIFAHLIMPKLYTPISLCFPLPPSFSRISLIDTLTEGLHRVFTAFPWLAGHIVWQNDTGLPIIIPLDTSNRLIVRDDTHSAAMPSLNDLRAARFPFSMLDGTLLAPLKGAPTSRDGDISPVFIVQVTFIRGGLFLTFAGEHSCIDGHGMGQIIRLYSQACRGEDFSEAELQQGNHTGRDLISLLDRESYRPGPELDYLIPKHKHGSSSFDMSSQDCAWNYFHFPSPSLSALKELATPSTDDDDADDGTSIPYITTDDALSAFIWKSITRIRSLRLPPTTTSTLARAVDLRPSLSISPFYLHNMANHTHTTLPLSTLLAASLSQLARLLRHALDPSSLAYAIRSLATHISLRRSVPHDDTNGNDAPKVGYGSNMSFDRDLFCSSWAGLDCYAHDFALGLGLPETVRRPRFMAVAGLVYLLPRDRSGGIDAAISLTDEEMLLLKEDEVFGKWAEWIG